MCRPLEGTNIRLASAMTMMERRAAKVYSMQEFSCYVEETLHNDVNKHESFGLSCSYSRLFIQVIFKPGSRILEIPYT